MPSTSSIENEFTPEEWERIRAYIQTRGMTFEVFLPESSAEWLRAKLAAGLFRDANEAAFVAFRDLQELDRHPKVREQLLKAMLEESLRDPRSGISLEQLRTEHRARLREWANGTPSGHVPSKRRRHTTGRNQQINIKATPQVIERLYKMADAKWVPLGELLEQALAALEKSVGQGGG
jgi:Arc/MetJ-type ribon-helix-helix transcriptional regulator